MILIFFLQIQAEWCFSFSKKGHHAYVLNQENYGNIFSFLKKKADNKTNLDH